MRRLAVALVCATLAVGACSGEQPEPTSAVAAFRTANGEVRSGHLEVADAPVERERGLAGRPWIPENGGMAFLFEETTTTAFWMRGTVIPLSIAFWDDGGQIVAILDMEPCRTEPCELYSPKTPYAGAVEMRQGWFEEHGVEVGDAVELTLG